MWFTGPPLMKLFGEEGVYMALTLTAGHLPNVKAAHGGVVLRFLLSLLTVVYGVLPRSDTVKKWIDSTLSVLSAKCATR